MEHLLSISLVTWNNSLTELSTTIKAIQAAAIKTHEQHHTPTHLYLLDVSENKKYFNALFELVNLTFPNNNSLQISLNPYPNLGYGATNNIAIKQTKAQFHIVMNPDVTVFENTFTKAIDYMTDNPKVGLLTPAVISKTGFQYYLCKRDPRPFTLFVRRFLPAFLKKRFQKNIDHHEMRDHDYSQPITNVEFPTGCFMFTRTDHIQQIGGFDERFFLYLEDADLGRRLRQIAEIHYNPDVKIQHDWKRASYIYIKRTFQHGVSALKYWKKWGTKKTITPHI